MVDQGWPGSGTSQSMPSLVMRYGLWPSAVEALTNLAMMFSTNSGWLSESASQFWKMSRQLPSKYRTRLPCASRTWMSKRFQGRLGSPCLRLKVRGRYSWASRSRSGSRRAAVRASSAGPDSTAASPSRKVRWRSAVRKFDRRTKAAKSGPGTSYPWT